MDRSGSWDSGAPEQRPWTQGPWHDGSWQAHPADQARSQGTWNQGPWAGGFGDGGFVADWTAATVAARTLARRVLRSLLLSALAGLAVAAGLVALAVAVWPHGFLAALLVLLAVPVLLVSLAMAAVVWAGRRAWRGGGWLEAVPMATGMPWLSRVIWAVRAALAGKGLPASRPASRRRTRRCGRRPPAPATARSAPAGCRRAVPRHWPSWGRGLLPYWRPSSAGSTTTGWSSQPASGRNLRSAGR